MTGTDDFLKLYSLSSLLLLFSHFHVVLFPSEHLKSISDANAFDWTLGANLPHDISSDTVGKKHVLSYYSRNKYSLYCDSCDSFLKDNGSLCFCNTCTSFQITNQRTTKTHTCSLTSAAIFSYPCLMKWACCSKQNTNMSQHA